MMKYLRFWITLNEELNKVPTLIISVLLAIGTVAWAIYTAPTPTSHKNDEVVGAIVATLVLFLAYFVVTTLLTYGVVSVVDWCKERVVPAFKLASEKDLNITPKDRAKVKF